MGKLSAASERHFSEHFFNDEFLAFEKNKKARDTCLFSTVFPQACHSYHNKLDIRSILLRSVFQARKL